MNTLEQQQKRLETEVLAVKEQIWQIRDSRFPDLKLLNQFNETIERNMQLIDMIALHLRPASRQQAAD
ncbi:MAG: hypothetical protein ACJASG_001165 [Oleiphilaceae bacterium]|jgi:hypothetical protein